MRFFCQDGSVFRNEATIFLMVKGGHIVVNRMEKVDTIGWLGLRVSTIRELCHDKRGVSSNPVGIGLCQGNWTE
jgi:hypothetical protein